MGEVSVYEAKRALDRDLENFRAKVSNRSETKIGRWFAIAGIAGCLAIYNPHGIGGYLSAIATALIPALIIGAIGDGIGALTLAPMNPLILKRGSTSRSSGEWSDDAHDVLADGIVVGRILKVHPASKTAINMTIKDRH
jgi:hypothetical protein